MMDHQMSKWMGGWVSKWMGVSGDWVGEGGWMDGGKKAYRNFLPSAPHHQWKQSYRCAKQYALSCSLLSYGEPWLSEDTIAMGEIPTLYAL